MIPTERLVKLYNSHNSNNDLNAFLDSLSNVVLDFLPNELVEEKRRLLANLTIDFKINGSSEFDYFKNTIFVLNREIRNVEVYLHEIFHAMGCKVQGDTVKIGMLQLKHMDLFNDDLKIKNDKAQNINDEYLEISTGKAINEGANTYFTAQALEKYNLAKVNPQNVTSSYRFCTNIFSSMAMLLSEEDCKKVHFDSGLYGLIKLVRAKCNRRTDSKLYKLISSLDSFINISQVNNWIGVDYTPDARAVLIDAYKSVVDLFIFQAEHNGNIVKLGEMLTDFYLTEDDKQYFIINILPQLENHYNHRMLKKYSAPLKQTFHIDYNTATQIAKCYIDDIRRGLDINGDYLPEKYKCGEFYNYLLVCVSVVDGNYEKLGIKTNDLQQVLTKALFDKSKNFMPKDNKKKVETVKQILSTRIAVRAGVEISDEIILDCLAISEDFNYFFMDSNPSYYKVLYPQISGNIKFLDGVVKKAYDEIFTTHVEKYKFKKYLEKNNIVANVIEEIQNIK